ncbi:MAG: sensor histidine kinase [Syntrophomonadaceae bacterium]|nr:sensor histidine kinase [Syntrophomonadaceae bacterium]MDD4550176.1 sensor histidine kinase [Syntrophomonadaceae bacterium]
MKLKEYLLDQIYLIVFYILLMTFITAVIYLDPTVKVWTNNIVYLNVAALFLFGVYLLGTYLLRKGYYTQMLRSIQEEKEAIYSWPAAYNYEQKLVRKLLFKIYDEQNSKIEEIYTEKKDNFEFISSWIHEIKTPIAVSKLLLENNSRKDKDELLNSLGEEIERIDRLVEQVLYYSKIDDFSRDYFVHELELNKVLSESIKKHAKIFIAKNIRIEMEKLDITVTTDKKWLLFILDQIISNSLKYTPPGGLIKVYAAKDEREKRLIIMDNGIGIRPEDIDRVFDRGFTGYNGREFSKSTGMGLYLARSLARKLGHDMSIDSVYGEHTRVTIHFPKLGNYYSVTKM